jgi:hypothetical protein
LCPRCNLGSSKSDMSMIWQKAVKLDNAKISIHLWDKAVCKGMLLKNQVLALQKLRVFFLWVYRRRLSNKTRVFLNGTHSKVKHQLDLYMGAVTCPLKPYRKELWHKVLEVSEVRNIE